MGGVSSTQFQKSLEGDYSTFTISKEDETTVRWTEKSSKQSWTLKFVPCVSLGGPQINVPGIGLLWFEHILDVQPDRPYYAGGYNICKITMKYVIDGVPDDVGQTLTLLEVSENSLVLKNQSRC